MLSLLQTPGGAGSLDDKVQSSVRDDTKRIQLRLSCLLLAPPCCVVLLLFLLRAFHSSVEPLDISRNNNKKNVTAIVAN